MTRSKILSAALLGAAMLAAPAMARETHVARHLADRANATAMSGERYIDSRGCIPAPRVGAFASDPWDNGPPCEPQAY